MNHDNLHTSATIRQVQDYQTQRTLEQLQDQIEKLQAEVAELKAKVK